ncbi:MAG: extracellular solute-binding protein [Anaerolineae bacterium]|nr:extracellular solute-binding protein [Anaerolineae bacterium]
MKSRRVLRIAVALLAVVVSALFVTAQEDGSIMTRDAEGHQITAWGWDTLEFNRPILDYLEEHSGVVVEDLVFPSSEITQKLTVSAAAGGIGMPDVFKSGTYNVPLLVEMGALMDLTDLVAPYRDLLPEVAWGDGDLPGQNLGSPGQQPCRWTVLAL